LYAAAERRSVPSTQEGRDTGGRPVGQVKIGALCWNQYSAWPQLLAAGVRADELGYDSL